MEVKPIIITDNSTKKEYTLEFSRETVRFAEQRGFRIDDVEAYPMTKVYELWFYAFRMHHKALSKQQTDDLLDKWFGGIGNLPASIMERLGEIYAAPFNAMASDEYELDGEGKNGQVTVTL